MPTGYTATLYDGKPQSFEEFALDCARAFAWWMRDSSSPVLTNPPEQTYSQKSLAEWQEKLSELEAQTFEEYSAEHEREYWRIREANAEHARNNAQLLSRYTAMRRKVVDWEPPTEAHNNLRSFMLEQLDSSIQHDCSEWVQKITMQPIKWQDERIEHARKIVAIYEVKAAEEAERNQQNLVWTEALRASLTAYTTEEAA